MSERAETESQNPDARETPRTKFMYNAPRWENVHFAPPPPVVHTPLFVWHLAIWNPVAVPIEQSDDAAGPILQQAAALNVNLAIERHRWLLKIDLFIADLYAKIMAERRSEEEPGVEAEFLVGGDLHLFHSTIASPLDSSRRRIIPQHGAPVGDGHEQVRTMRAPWHGAWVTFRVEVHAEIVTLTVYIDMSSFKVPSDRERDGTTGLNDLCRLSEGLSDLNDLLRKNEQSSKKYAEVFQKLYYTPRRTILKHLLGMKTEDVQKFGRAFADFRGLVLTSPVERPGDADAQPFFLLQGPPRGDDSTRIVAPALKPEQWQIKLRRLWPFLKTPPAENVDPKKHEFSISRMLGGRAMLATTLSLQPREFERKPLFYFINTTGTSPWETGRLIALLSRLGTFRLAALLNMEKVHQVASRLNVSETLVREALDRISTVLGSDGLEALSPEEQLRLAKKRADILAQYLPQIGESLKSITDPFSRQNVPNEGIALAPDNFERRLALSRVYARKFRQNVGRLRIGRMEGYLPYDEFVEHRLGATYAMVDLISTRFRQVRTDMNTLRQIEIAQQGRIAEAQTTQLQKTAEWILFLIFIPYYFGEVLLEKVLRSEKHAWLERRVGLLWLAIWIASATLANEGVRKFIKRAFIRPGKALDEYDKMRPMARLILTAGIACTAGSLIAALRY